MIDPTLLAAWESATVQTLNPLLDEPRAIELWAAIEANRTALDADAFAQRMAEITVASPPSFRLLEAGLNASVNLRSLLTAHTE